MKKLSTLVLMLCLILSGALCYANDVARTEKGEGTPIEVKEKASHSGLDKSASIMLIIEGHTLTVTFTENLGQVSIEISTAAGVPVDLLSITTPNGYIWNIPLTGDYIITFTLPNGDEYYGEFTVTD